MTAFAVDPETGDFPLECLGYVSGKDELCQCIEQTLCLIQGESCFFPEAGLDWFNPRFYNLGNLDFIERIVRSKVLEIAGIQSITSFAVNVVDRVANYSITVQRDDGDPFTVTGGLANGF